MAKVTTKEQENLLIKEKFLMLLRNLCIERRKYLNYEIKIVSSSTKISKEELVNFEKGIDDLTQEKLLILTKFYAITVPVILGYIYKITQVKENKKEVKEKNVNLTENQAEELSSLIGFKGFKK